MEKIECLFLLLLLLLLSRAIYMFNYFHSFHHYSCFIKVSFNLYGKSEKWNSVTKVLKMLPNWRPEAKGSIFKPEVDLFIFFPCGKLALQRGLLHCVSESAYVPSTNDS